MSSFFLLYKFFVLNVLLIWATLMFLDVFCFFLSFIEEKIALQPAVVVDIY